MLDEKELIRIKKTGLLAARRAGEFIKKRFWMRKKVSFKEGHDIVTDSDIASEKIIKKTIREVFPKHNVIGEETGFVYKGSDFIWIIDPIDGTSNFASKSKLFNVSIGVAYKGELVFGVVNAPMLDDIFYAVKGKGAYHNNKKIHVSETKELCEAIVAVGVMHLRSKEAKRPDMNIMKEVSRTARSPRTLGSAALELCYVASGIFGGFITFKQKIWDFAAGILIIQEAGGRVTDFKGDKIKIGKAQSSSIIASNNVLHKQFLNIALGAK